jgi:hypothetical protein
MTRWSTVRQPSKLKKRRKGHRKIGTSRPKRQQRRLRTQKCQMPTKRRIRRLRARKLRPTKQPKHRKLPF